MTGYGFPDFGFGIADFGYHRIALEFSVFSMPCTMLLAVTCCGQLAAVYWIQMSAALVDKTVYQ